jgi:hypothetical protein
VEVGVPQLRRYPVSETRRVFTMEAGHVGIDTLDDPLGQIQSSHHWWTIDGRPLHHSAPYRYVWPSELVLMARVAGLRLEHRWAGWDRAPFTADSTSQVAVFELPRG